MADDLRREASDLDLCCSTFAQGCGSTGYENALTEYEHEFTEYENGFTGYG